MKYYSFRSRYVVRAKNKKRATKKIKTYLDRKLVLHPTEFDLLDDAVWMDLQEKGSQGDSVKGVSLDLGKPFTLLTQYEESAVVAGFRGDLPRIRITKDIVKLPDSQF